MKTFNELTKRELCELSEMQVDAYVDIELANQNITKPISVSIDFPKFVSIVDKAPEKDMEIYECGGYTFADMESAQRFSTFVGTLPLVRTNYDWSVGSEHKYVQEQMFETPSVAIVKCFSEAKYRAVAEQLKHLKGVKEKQNRENNEVVNDVINYDAIDSVRYQIKSKVREAIEFFAKVEKVADDYNKYFSITNDSIKAYETLYTVYNIQDQEFKDEVTELLKARLN